MGSRRLSAEANLRRALCTVGMPVLISAALLLPASVRAQIRFERTYGCTRPDRGSCVQRTADGGYIISGTSEPGLPDVYLVKTDSCGDTLWTRRIHVADYDIGGTVQQTTDGGYIIAGYTYQYFGITRGFLLKTDADGDRQWQRIFRVGGLDFCRSVQQTADGGYIVAGNAAPYNMEAWLIKTNASGDTLWTRTYGDTYAVEGYSVVQTGDGGYAVVGNTWSCGSYQVYLLRTDANGDVVWTRTYGGAGDDRGHMLRQTPDGGYIVVGRFSGDTNEGVYLIKTDSAGDTLWTRTFGGALADRGNSVSLTADSCYIVAGMTKSFGAGVADVYLLKVDANGDTLWTRTFGGSLYDEGASVQQTADGGYIIAGSTMSYGAGDYDVYLIKTDSAGSSVAVAEPEICQTRASAFSLYCEPNPFRTQTVIRLLSAFDGSAECAVFSASGRCVRTLALNSELHAVWDGRDEVGAAAPSGTYFIRARIGNGVAVRSALLLD